MSEPSTVPVLPRSYAPPRITSTREHLVPAAEHLWRVQENDSGKVLGHLRVLTDPLGLRYRAERLQLASGAFRMIGEFWQPDDAVSVLRYS